MSIVTRKGDHGTTGLLYNRRVSKGSLRVEAYGAVDELTAALGVARAAARRPALRQQLLATQHDLVVLMGELATAPRDQARYARDGFRSVDSEMTTRLETIAAQLEAQLKPFRGWALPGGNTLSAALDVARTVCRRAERCVCRLADARQHVNPMVLVFLNRLADVLWLWARQVEGKTKSAAARRRKAKRAEST